jgi:hypothetical protein
MLSSEQAVLALHYDHRDREAAASRQRLVAAARLQRRARRRAVRAERASRRAATAEAQARLAWAELV